MVPVEVFDDSMDVVDLNAIPKALAAVVVVPAVPVMLILPVLSVVIAPNVRSIPDPLSRAVPVMVISPAPVDVIFDDDDDDASIPGLLWVLSDVPVIMMSPSTVEILVKHC